jgi:hypothetical protein
MVTVRKLEAGAVTDIVANSQGELALQANSNNHHLDDNAHAENSR